MIVLATITVIVIIIVTISMFMARWYSYSLVILEIEGTMQKPDGWVMKAPVSLRQVSNSSGDDEE